MSLTPRQLLDQSDEPVGDTEAVTDMTNFDAVSALRAKISNHSVVEVVSNIADRALRNALLAVGVGKPAKAANPRGGAAGKRCSPTGGLYKPPPVGVLNSKHPHPYVNRCSEDDRTRFQRYSPDVRTLLESLIWVIVARRSQRPVPFSGIDFDRVVKAFSHIGLQLLQMIGPHGKEQTWLKYHLDTLLLDLFGDKSGLKPDRPDFCPDIWTGWLRRFISRAKARRDLSLGYSLQKGSKKLWPALSHERMVAALEKHRKLFSEPHGKVSLELGSSIFRVSTRVFRDLATADLSKMMPSMSACIESSRRNGGCLGLFEPMESPNAILRSKTAVGENGKPGIGRLPALSLGIDSWRERTYSIAHAQASQLFINQLVVDRNSPIPVLIAPARPLPGRGFKMQAVALPEPGKFRIITKFSGWVSTALQPLQGSMLSKWKSSRASTMRTEDLTSRIQAMYDAVSPFKEPRKNELRVKGFKLREFCEDEWVFCSVDYAAATDTIKKDATLLAFVAGAASHPDFYLGLLSLHSGKLEYPKDPVTRKYLVPPVDHIDGQPMGHPLSFPLLCVINQAVLELAVHKWADNKSKRLIGRVVKKFVIVNGDDMLFYCPRSLYSFFTSCSADAGFVPSQGKQYVSADCALINSQLFRVVSSNVRRFGYLNLKLISGSSLKGGDSMCTPTQIGPELGRMAKLCNWTVSAIPAAFRRWSKEWLGDRYSPNWYLPVHLGGFGVPLEFAPLSMEITKNQLELAARFISDPRMLLCRMQGIGLKTAQLSKVVAKFRLVPGPYVRKEGENTEVAFDWLAKLAFATQASIDASEVGAERAQNMELYGTPDVITFSHFKPQQRLKPISLAKLDLYWTAQLIAYDGPFAPPPRNLRVVRGGLNSVFINYSDSGSLSDTMHAGSPYQPVVRTVKEIVTDVPGPPGLGHDAQHYWEMTPLQQRELNRQYEESVIAPSLAATSSRPLRSDLGFARWLDEEVVPFMLQGSNFLKRGTDTILNNAMPLIRSALGVGASISVLAALDAASPQLFSRATGRHALRAAAMLLERGMIDAYHQGQYPSHVQDRLDLIGSNPEPSFYEFPHVVAQSAYAAVEDLTADPGQPSALRL